MTQFHRKSFSVPVGSGEVTQEKWDAIFPGWRFAAGFEGIDVHNPTSGDMAHPPGETIGHVFNVRGEWVRLHDGKVWKP